jgi:ribonucleoside-diphosphate reductase alpha chain
VVEELPEELPEELLNVRGSREHLPDEREGLTKKFEIYGRDMAGREKTYKGYVTVNFYPDGRPGELFIRFAKIGGAQVRYLDGWATMVSIALQSGTTLACITSKFSWARFEPAGLTSDPDIPHCTSPLDYICRWMSKRFGEGEAEKSEPTLSDMAAFGEEPA